MKIFDNIVNAYKSRRHAVLIDKVTGRFFSPFAEPRFEFSRAIFANICDLLTDLCNDVEFKHNGTGDIMRFVEFRLFFNTWGHVVLNRLFVDGFCVIGKRENGGFFIMSACDYSVKSDTDASIVVPHDPSIYVYVMRSPCFIERGVSDYVLVRPFLEFLDNVLNSSNTISARMGAVVVMSPKSGANNPTTAVLRADEKERIEKQLAEEYGSLSRQKQILLLPREMDFQTLNLSALDVKLQERVRIAILAICDRIKVPANQVAIIDANSSKSLSNGSELREGDFSKYQSFERLLNSTFVEWAKSLGFLNIDYTIYNKPTRTASL